ncbi:citrate lyase subunit alpha [Variovorax sp. efr-133-TYG-130]|uniref:citrate lyase subunit alpha n=1 Tax=Variovorax sp. efr-133-TYG-130 TaxID=3040327 RepID=UPI0025567A72|nr:citrate lyase subunit alpha [Variovorax sp. efr-133-TYG-130]
MNPDRALPSFIEGYGTVRPYRSSEPLNVAKPASVRMYAVQTGHSKCLASIDAALQACEVGDGATLSFHHHLRNGDHVLNMVMEVCAARGLKGLTVAASSLFPIHAPLVAHMRSGLVARIVTAYMSGPVADAVSDGVLSRPVVMQTHGGRARSIETGELHIDVAFIGAPSADDYGNINGAHGPSACGPLGYAMVDARYADRVVAVTDHLVPYPACPIDISQDLVDFVVRVDSIGDPKGILSGTTRPTSDPVGLEIAHAAARVIAASGLLVDGFSFQTGAGGISLAVAMQLRALMQASGVKGSFAAGGITGHLCAMLDEGLFRTLFDVQCFDLASVESYRRDPRHQAMSASLYASPCNRGAVVDRLDAMILGAAEVDVDFNVNVITGSTGRILGGSGGHADTAAGSKLAIVTTRLASAAGPKIVQRVNCVTTPGESIDVVVTEAGIAVNPRRNQLARDLVAAGLPVKSIDELCVLAAAHHGPRTPRKEGVSRVVGVVEYRDGSVIDVIRLAPRC